MKTFYRLSEKWLLLCTAAVASLPLAVHLADSIFGLASALVVPILAVSLLSTVTSRQRARLWWFAFTCSTAVWLLAISPLVESATHGTAVGLQRLVQRGVISLSQRIIEPAALALIFLLPPIGAVLSGVGMGQLTNRWTHRRGRRQSREGGNRWRFSLREVLAASFALCAFLALAFGRMRSDQARERDAKAAFLARFEESFVTQKVQLLSRPNIIGGHRALIPESGYMSLQPPGINEYRVTAPILRNKRQRWAAWVYTCNGNYDDMIYQFAYAEADSKKPCQRTHFQ